MVNFMIKPAFSIISCEQTGCLLIATVQIVQYLCLSSDSGRARRASKGGAPCPHFENEKSTLPFWPSQSSTLPFLKHQNIEKIRKFYISG